MAGNTKKIFSYVLGPIIWLISSILFLLIAVQIWNFSSESVLGLSFTMYIATVMGAVIGFNFSKNINDELSQKTFFIILTSFIAIWLIFGVIESLETEMFTYRIASFIASLIGVFSAFIYSNDN